MEVAEVGGYSVCIGKGDFKDGDLGVYIPPDSIVPQMEAFRFIWEGKGYTPEPGADSLAEAMHLTLQVPEKYRRIKAKTLRGVISEGLLMPVTSLPALLDYLGPKYKGVGTDEELQEHLKNGNGITVGQDVAEILGITHYDPPDTTSLGGDAEIAPGKDSKKRRYPKTLRGWFRFLLSKVAFWRKPTDVQEHTDLGIPEYDIDAWQKHRGALVEGEEVWITEKIHGANSRFVWVPDYVTEKETPQTEVNGRMYCGSHHQWKKDLPGSAWWICLKQNPWIKEFCETYPNFVLYGELVPTQKPYMYGQKDGKYRLFAFDVYDQTLRRFLSWPELLALTWCHLYAEGEDFQARGILDEVHWVPTIFKGPYDSSAMRTLAEGKSIVPYANHIREGIIIKPVEERRDNRLGRVIMKLKSVKFLEKDK